MNRINNSKGFTLLELIVVISIIGLVITTIFSILFFGYDVYGRTQKDFDMQSQVRVAMEEMGNLIRDSRAVFAVPSIEYKDPEWRYIAVNSTGDKVVSFSFDTVHSRWEEKVLMGPFEGVTFKIGFDKLNSMSKDNTLRMYVEAYTDGGLSQRFDIQSGYQALNALQVIDYGTEAAPAIALAYRSDEFVYENQKLIVNIALVLDYSGSMNWNIDETKKDNVPVNERRITILRTKVKELVAQFASNQNENIEIYISATMFDETANIPTNETKHFFFVRNTTERTTLLERIDNRQADNGTNTGDGFRRAYHKLKNKSDNDNPTNDPNIIVKNYTIVLVDGDSNYFTGDARATCFFGLFCRDHEYRSYYLGDGNTLLRSFSNSFRTGAFLLGEDHPIVRGYDTVTGKMLVDNDFSTAYLISFGKINKKNGVITDSDSINNLKTALSLTDSHFFRADSEESLGLSFSDIQLQITNDYWHFLGPKLVE